MVHGLCNREGCSGLGVERGAMVCRKSEPDTSYQRRSGWEWVSLVVVPISCLQCGQRRISVTPFLRQADLPRPLLPVGHQVFKVGCSRLAKQEVTQKPPPVVKKHDEEDGASDKGDDDEGDADHLPGPDPAEKLMGRG